MGSTDSNCCGSHGFVISDDPDIKAMGRNRKYQNIEPSLLQDHESPSLPQQQTQHIQPQQQQQQHQISKSSKISNHMFEITANIKVNSSSNLREYNRLPSIILNFDGPNAMAKQNYNNMNIQPHVHTQPHTIYKQYTNTKNNYNNNFNSPSMQPIIQQPIQIKPSIITPIPMIPSNNNNNKNENISNYNHSNWIENVYDDDHDHDHDEDNDEPNNKNNINEIEIEIDIDNDALTHIDTTNTVRSRSHTDNETSDEEDNISYLSEAQNMNQNINQNINQNMNHSESDDNDADEFEYDEDNQQHYYNDENKYDLDNMPTLQLADDDSNKPIQPVNYLRHDEIILGNLLTPQVAQNWKKEDMDKLEAEMLMEKRRLSVSTGASTLSATTTGASSLNSL